MTIHQKLVLYANKDSTGMKVSLMLVARGALPNAGHVQMKKIAYLVWKGSI